jgi:hypothetical protein
MHIAFCTQSLAAGSLVQNQSDTDQWQRGRQVTRRGGGRLPRLTCHRSKLER